MNTSSWAFSVLLLSEDSSRYAPSTLKNLLKHIFKFIDERCQTHRIDFQPPDDDEVRRILIMSQWVHRRRVERIRLYKYIAERLREDTAFVVHHIDADMCWDGGAREPGIVARVPEEILAHVRVFLARFYPDIEIDRRLRRYLLLVPYWEIEAWLYQHTDVALKLCREHPTCRGAHVGMITSWRIDRALLDQREDPEELLRPCVGKHHNKTLAGPGYPIKEVVDADTSLAAAVRSFFDCDPLLDALALTYQQPPS